MINRMWLLNSVVSDLWWLDFEQLALQGEPLRELEGRDVGGRRGRRRRQGRAGLPGAHFRRKSVEEKSSGVVRLRRKILTQGDDTDRLQARAST